MIHPDHVEAYCYRPDATVGEIQDCIDYALQLQCAQLSLPSYFIHNGEFNLQQLRHKELLLGTFVGMPFGHDSSLIKTTIIKFLGPLTDYIDVVLNHHEIATGAWNQVQDELTLLSEYHRWPSSLNFVIEPIWLDFDQLIRTVEFIVKQSQNISTIRGITLGTGCFSYSHHLMVKTVFELLRETDLELKVMNPHPDHMIAYENWGIAHLGLPFHELIRVATGQENVKTKN